MIYLLYGPDQFSQKEFIKDLAKTQGLAVESYDSTDVPPLFKLVEADLFGKPKLIVLNNLVTALELLKQVEILHHSPQTLIFVEEKLDKRTKISQGLLKNSFITVKEFIVPPGQALQNWLKQRTKHLGGKISANAALALAEALGDGKVDTELNLWQADSELQKLIQYANGQEISSEMINLLVAYRDSAPIWDIINAIAQRNSKTVFSLYEIFFRASGGDDKTKTIQLNALLADQFRNLLAVQSFVEQDLSDADILQRTSWKPGRLFILRKNAQSFSPKKIQSLLSKFEHLDWELKNTSTPPRVLLDLITVQAIA